MHMGKQIMTNEEIARFFNNARPHIQGNANLRDPQVEPIYVRTVFSALDNAFRGKV